jgi:hypothetical protein
MTVCTMESHMLLVFVGFAIAAVLFAALGHQREPEPRSRRRYPRNRPYAYDYPEESQGGCANVLVIAGLLIALLGALSQCG